MVAGRLSSLGSVRHRRLAAGLFGQGLNFVAMLVPAAFAPREALISLVVVTSITTGTFLCACLATPMRYPSIADETQASAAAKAAMISTAAVSAATLAAGLCLLAVGERLIGAYTVGVAALLFFQTTDNLLISWFVRTNNATAIGVNRLRYGAANCLITPPAALLLHWRWSLVAAASAVYAVALCWVAWSFRHDLRRDLGRAWGSRWADVRAYTRQSVRPVTSYALDGFGSQSAGVATVGIGMLAAPWAVVIRIAGGFGTVTQQLIAPSYDARLSAALRGGDAAEVRASIRAGTRIGGVMAVVSVTAALLVCVATRRGADLSAGGWAVLVACAFLYWGTALLGTPLYKVLTLTGSHTARLTWDVTRVVTVLVCLSFARGEALLLSLSITLALSNVWLVAVANWVGRSYRPPAPERDAGDVLTTVAVDGTPDVVAADSGSTPGGSRP